VPSNVAYTAVADLPATLAVFPLPGALLLPRGEMPLNIFEPRYLAMIDDALRTNRVIGMIQPRAEEADDKAPAIAGVGCAGRLTALQETGDGRYLITLTGLARFRVVGELAAETPYRQCRVDFASFADDLVPGAGEEAVDRAAVMKTLEAYLSANQLEADWAGIRKASNEALVNALAMMSPYGVREKQALLEAPDLKTRAEILVAVTEMELARTRGGDTDNSLQ
jgi:Lon protease-like protein